MKSQKYKVISEVLGTILSVFLLASCAKQEAIEVAEGGNLWISYTVPYMSERLLSVRMEVSSYVLFTVHPSGYFYAINYDRQAGEVLALGDLFQPGSDYVGVLSRYCLSDLEKQGVLYWDDGAQPTAENYEGNWNFTPWGLLITFDEYEVAPYAAGAQTVIIPFAELQGIAEPNGPLRTELSM